MYKSIFSSLVGSSWGSAKARRYLGYDVERIDRLMQLARDCKWTLEKEVEWIKTTKECSIAAGGNERHRNFNIRMIVTDPQ